MRVFHTALTGIVVTLALIGCDRVPDTKVLVGGDGSGQPPSPRAEITSTDGSKAGVLKVTRADGQQLELLQVTLTKGDDGTLTVESNDGKGIYLKMVKSPTPIPAFPYICKIGCLGNTGRPYQLPAIWGWSK